MADEKWNGKNIFWKRPEIAKFNFPNFAPLHSNFIKKTFMKNDGISGHPQNKM